MGFIVAAIVVLSLTAVMWLFAGRRGWVERSVGRAFAAYHLFELLLVLIFAFFVYLVYLALG